MVDPRRRTTPLFRQLHPLLAASEVYGDRRFQVHMYSTGGPKLVRLGRVAAASCDATDRVGVGVLVARSAKLIGQTIP